MLHYAMQDQWGLAFSLATCHLLTSQHTHHMIELIGCNVNLIVASPLHAIEGVSFHFGSLTL
jgi:hypothetical protein